MPPQNQNTPSMSAAPPPTLKEKVLGLFHPMVNPDVSPRNKSGTPGNYSLHDEWNKTSKEDQDNLLKSMSPEEVEEFATKMGWYGHATGIQAQPSIGSIPWMKEKAYSLLNPTANQLPTIGGVTGGLVGGGVGAGVAPEGGEIPGKYIGSGIGGGIGEAARQGIEHLTGADKYDDPETKTWGNRLEKITHQGELQTAGEVAGHYLGKWMRPTLERSIAKLSYAGGLDRGNPLGKGDLETVIDDMMKTEKATGKALTVRDLVGVLKDAKNDNGQLVDSQMMLPINQNGHLITLAKATADPTPIAKAISDMATADPSIIRDARLNPAGKEAAYLAHIQREALNYAKDSPTYEELMSKRIRLNNELAPLYELKTPGEKRVYLLDHPELAVKKAEADAIRDVIYPKMDILSGKAMGTTAELQNKRGLLMSLEQQATKHLGDLQTKALKAQGAPPLEKVNISSYGTTTGKPGLAFHRLSGLVHTPNPEHAADTQVKKAFGHGIGTHIRKAVTSPFGEVHSTKLPATPQDRIGDELLSMPLRELVNPSQRKPDEGKDGPQSSVSTPKELKERAKRLNPAANGQVAYSHVAVNPATGHQIGSLDNGKTWFDVSTGQKVA